MDERQPSAGANGLGHEVRDIQIWRIVVLAAGLLILAGLAMFSMARLYDYFAAHQARLAAPPVPLASTQPPPAPRLEVVPDQLLQELRGEEEVLLHSYGWVDREAAVVRIPIERAMALLVERGLPFRAEPQESSAGGRP